MLRCGIIGFGKMGTIRAKAVAQSNRAKVVKIFDTCEDHTAGSEFDVVATEAEITNSDDIDVVLFAHPTIGSVRSSSNH